jgi:hypothetical protein
MEIQEKKTIERGQVLGSKPSLFFLFYFWFNKADICHSFFSKKKHQTNMATSLMINVLSTNKYFGK